ncbi:MAG: T9SS type A sorting domain-containing protein, partial [Bacteroidetes bacterium]|nr:T9SS type A sorting domain-containing protein [Bacteroidota bacterium]
SWSFTVRVSGGAAVFRSIGNVPVSEYPQFLCAADLDGNGNAEIIVGNTSGNAVSIVSWNGAAFVTAGNIPVGSFQNDVGAGDLDSDGLIDLVVNRTGSVVLLKNSGAFQFTQTSLLVPADAYGQAIGDFDGDGKLDIAVGSRTDHTVRIFRNTGAMGFTLMGSPYAVESPQQLTANDFDNDGSIDILASKTSGNSFTLLRNDGYGIFTPVILPNIGMFVRTMIAADLNNDHRLDIAAEQSGNNSITILRNNGGLQFQSFPQSGVSYDPLSIASADLDGDRDIDIVSVNNGFSLTGSIYLNDSMRFRQKSTFAIESGSHNTIAQDLNGDGTMDIALVNQASSSISVLFNFSSGGNLLSRQSADLGDVKIGDSAAENIVLWRGLPDTVTIDTAYVRGGIFSVQTGKRSVGPFDSAAFRIVFTPPGTGFFTDTLTVKIGKDPEYTVLLSGTGTPVSGVVQNDGTIPAVFSLDQNYPNPFNPSTTIRFGLPEQSRVEITVYNILGQKISDIVNTVLDAGFYHQHWTAPRSSGAYIYQMNAVGINPPYHRFQRTGKMMLVR